tara:strand:- start:13641 stop:14015 length:375 start_codon:yes stop_codon:yes gene_type:complete
MNIEFNKETKSGKGSSEATIVFRKLKSINSNDRYQGSINSSGLKLMDSIVKSRFYYLQILFSDEHSIIGVKPVRHESKMSKFFGATELFKDLNLLVGKHYKVKVQGDIITIDSDQFNSGDSNNE